MREIYFAASLCLATRLLRNPGLKIGYCYCAASTIGQWGLWDVMFRMPVLRNFHINSGAPDTTVRVYKLREIQLALCGKCLSFS